MQSFFRNWHKPASCRQTKKQALCNTWWPRASKHANTGIEIEFTQGDSDKRITFALSHEHANHLYKQLTELLTK